MGKKKSKGEYNDFLDGEKLRDNTEIRTTLQGFASRDIPSPSVQKDQKDSKKPGKGGAKKPQLTHFLCLPLVTDSSRPQLQQRLENFKEELSKDGPVPTKAVRLVGTLHLTLGVMSLSPQQLSSAQEYLLDLDLHTLLRDITHLRVAEAAAESGEIAENLNAAAMPDTDALTVNLESLVPMQAPHKTSILYAEPRDVSQRLYPFAEALRERFTEMGLLVEDTRPLRLHATVLNTIYAKPKGRGGRGRTESSRPIGEGHGPDGKSWMRFDARNLIEKYKGFVWAEGVRVDRVCICKMGAKKIWSGGAEGQGEVVDERYEVVCEKEIF
ncbi:hypothetical protein J4E86_010698 [Alternaria arbusti]|uniref:uncharacterized protein n=1 Tax=Alternaria arbusti TaxID=232088 RepID=UPI00221EDB61|nr:uncharacterized protein J4E86_010698 [Alternaria arbusti]KAI4940726.1 hypothetical protein J4E86_010698 [Alternaria arbusti]